MAKRLKPPYFGKYTVFCPFCNSKETRWIFQDDIEFSCCVCSKKSRIFIATIRKKQSTKVGSSRAYCVELVTHSGKKEILFHDDYCRRNLPLKAGDIAIFQYSAEPKLVMVVYEMANCKHYHLHKLVPPEMREKYNKKNLSKISWWVQTYLEDSEFKKSAERYGWTPATI